MFFTLREEHMLRVVKNWVLRKICGASRAKVMGDRKNSITRSFIILTLYCILTSKRTIWVVHLAHVEGKKCIIQGSGTKTCRK
jgi:hypothetical protein